MLDYAKCCEDCVLNNNGCLFQADDDVESCGDYDYNEENSKQENDHE